jgi:hypothetical protein
MLEYSAKKKRTNPTAEYSTKYPATNSASASAKSKGGRLVSTNAEKKNRINCGYKYQQCQNTKLLWWVAI